MANPVALKVGHLKITDHLVLGITNHKLKTGMEKFQYCSIDPIALTDWTSVGEALTNGEVDVAFILAPYAMELFHSGVKIKMVLLSHKSGSIIVTNARANIKTIQDFKGKTVLIPYHLSIHHMLFDQLLNKNGLKTGVEADVKFEVVAPAQIPEAIEFDEDGDIGGYIVAEPYGTQVIKAGYGKQFALSKDIWPKHPCCIMAVSDAIIGKYPDAVHELTKSLVESGKLIENDVKTAVKVGAEFLSQKEDVINDVLTNPPDKLSTKELFPQINDFEKIQNYLTNEISAMSGKIDLEKFIDISFAKAAGAV